MLLNVLNSKIVLRRREIRIGFTCYWIKKHTERRGPFLILLGIFKKENYPKWNYTGATKNIKKFKNYMSCGSSAHDVAD